MNEYDIVFVFGWYFFKFVLRVCTQIKQIWYTCTMSNLTGMKYSIEIGLLFWPLKYEWIWMI